MNETQTSLQLPFWTGLCCAWVLQLGWTISCLVSWQLTQYLLISVELVFWEKASCLFCPNHVLRCGVSSNRGRKQDQWQCLIIFGVLWTSMINCNADFLCLVLEFMLDSPWLLWGALSPNMTKVCVCVPSVCSHK